MIYTRPDEFEEFYNILMSSAPDDYVPWLFALETHGKDPLASRPWAADKSRLSMSEAYRFLVYGFNVGISARDNDPLVLVDVDNMNDIPDKDVKPTMSVMTRSRLGLHYYYFSDDPECMINVPTESGEIRSCNQYLVCPGSYVSTDKESVPSDQIDDCGYYTLFNKTSPARIEYNEFPKVFRDHKALINKEPIPIHTMVSSGRKSKSVLYDLTIADVVSYPRHKTRFGSIFHGSESGANTAVSDGLLHCFRHLVSHNALQALSVVAGMFTCQQAGVSHRNGGAGPSMLDLRDGEQLYTLWNYARLNGYIPRDDHPPRIALNWFVVETGICTTDDVFGEMMPDESYREAMQLLRSIK